MKDMVKVSGLRKQYGAHLVLDEVSFTVRQGEIFGVIGVNGAGKTTLLKSISGMIHHTGSIRVDDTEISQRSPTKIAAMGIIHVPEGRHIFPGLTVRENLEVGTIAWHGFFGRKPYDAELEEVYALFPRLWERKDQLGWSLSGGEQQMLAIGRAMMARPKVLLLDEPSMGLAPIVVSELFDKIKEINQKGHTILLVEQNARLALKMSDHAYVLEHGEIAFSGDAESVRRDPRTVRAYLGKFAGKHTA